VNRMLFGLTTTFDELKALLTGAADGIVKQRMNTQRMQERRMLSVGADSSVSQDCSARCLDSAVVGSVSPRKRSRAIGDGNSERPEHVRRLGIRQRSLSESLNEG
jgi:hypothetical protein